MKTLITLVAGAGFVLAITAHAQSPATDGRVNTQAAAKKAADKAKDEKKGDAKK